MRLGRFKPAIGYAHRSTGKRYTYVVYRSMLDEYLHKTRPLDDSSAVVEQMRAENERLAAMLEASQAQTASLIDALKALTSKREEGCT